MNVATHQKENKNTGKKEQEKRQATSFEETDCWPLKEPQKDGTQSPYIRSLVSFLPVFLFFL